MIKTILTVPNWNGQPEGFNPVYQLKGWKATGQYSGESSQIVDPVTGTLTLTRWEWDSQESANEYKVLAETLAEYYPGTQVEIVVE